ncbi:MAG: glutamate mutase L, partial [Bacilli bacterium]|nr:glutamate mutase L [Bacilli bacterium]
MIIDVLVAEIGSTTTVINAFDRINTETPVFLGQGMAPTTVVDGDVTIGLENAIADLRHKLNIKTLEAKETFASSSAAGGLKMSVHGLVYDMTARAAKEAALGAGANLKLITAGILDDFQIKQVIASNLNIIMLAGGVDHGETKTAIENARKIAELRLNIPVIYAGNIQCRDQIEAIFTLNSQTEYLFLCDNVYPRIDVLQTEPARKIIQAVFEKHIVKAPGMEKVRKMISGSIIPTPGAVMEAAISLRNEIGDLVVFDIGGATTDLHSVCEGDKQVSKILIDPEPLAKRTVEGDLGVYINKDNLIDIIHADKLAKELQISQDDLMKMLEDYLPIPTPEQFPLVGRLAKEALVKAIERHAGHYIHLYGSSGKQT